MITNPMQGPYNSIMNFEGLQVDPQRNSLEPGPAAYDSGHAMAIKSGEKSFETSQFRNGRRITPGNKLSTQSRRTTSAYNATPRGADSQLNAKYSHQSQVRISPQYEERLAVNDTPLSPTVQDLERAGESQSGANHSQFQAKQSQTDHSSYTVAAHGQSRQGEGPARCVTPPSQGERSVVNQSPVLGAQPRQGVPDCANNYADEGGSLEHANTHLLKLSQHLAQKIPADGSSRDD